MRGSIPGSSPAERMTKRKRSIYIRASHKINHFLECGREPSPSLHGDDLIVFLRIYDIYHSVNHNPCHRVPSSRFGLKIIHALTLRCDAIRVRLRRQPSDGVALSQGRPVGERSSRIPDENRRSLAGGAVDRDGARTRENGCARGPGHARRPPHAASRVAAPKRRREIFLHATH